MSFFDECYDKLILHEGGYSNHPDDKGGETYKGISRVFHPNWPGWQVIDTYKTKPGFPKNLDELHELDQMCRGFYKLFYWDANKLDEILIKPLQWDLFEIAVNMGVGTAGKFLQEALNMLNRNQSMYPNLMVDGKIGNNTIKALMIYLQNDNGAILVNLINLLQAERYINNIRRNETQENFIRGWLKRVEIVKY